jgi:hypothetical protein
VFIQIKYSDRNIEKYLKAFIKKFSPECNLTVQINKIFTVPMLDNYDYSHPGFSIRLVDSRYFCIVENLNGSVYIYDSFTNKCFCGLRDFKEWHLSSPLRQLIHIHSSLKGEFLLHAASVCDSTKSILIGGPSFAGKSTLTAWAVASGFTSGGDDYINITNIENKWLSSFVYRTVKLRDTSPALGMLNNLEQFNVESDNRTIHYLESGHGLMTREPLPIHTVVTVGSSDQEELIRSVSSSHALLKLAPSTLTQSAFYFAENMQRIANLVRNVPTLEIRQPKNKHEVKKILDLILSKNWSINE